MPFKLISTEGDQAFELKGAATLVVGRALNSDIPVFDPTISRRHAELTVGADGTTETWGSVTKIGRAVGTNETEITTKDDMSERDDPFATFAEWGEDADDPAYRDL